ncbi:Apoptosis regulator BAX, partial [Stegodyphus mimosarum]
MAPDLLVKAAFVRGDCNNSKHEFVSRNSVRTDFILQNVYSYLIKDAYAFESCPATTRKEASVLKDLKEIVDAFRSNYLFRIQNLCSELDVTFDTVGSVLLGVSNELFSDGITWSRIIALFIFVAELTVQCLAQSFPVTIVDITYECFSRLVKENLLVWIEDHGGWEGLRSLSKTEKGDSNQLMNEQQTNGTLAKSILHGTIKVFGFFANLANQTAGLP